MSYLFDGWCERTAVIMWCVVLSCCCHCWVLVHAEGTCPLIHPNCCRSRLRYLFYRNMTAMTSLWRIVSHCVQFSKWTSGPHVIYAIVFATWRQCARLCDTWFLGSHESTPNGVCITFYCFTTAASRLSIVFARWHHCAPPCDAFPGVNINK